MGRNRSKSDLPESGKAHGSRKGVGGVPPSHISSPKTTESKQTVLALGVIVLVLTLIYSNTFSCPFVFDDETSIITNTTIRNPFDVVQILNPPNHGETVSGRPLLNWLMAINYAISAEEVWSYHIINLVIHTIVALLLFGTLYRTFLLPSMRERWESSALGLSFFITILWAIHPLQTESVTYIVQRAESLVALFYILTLYCVIRGTDCVEQTPSEISSAPPQTASQSRHGSPRTWYAAAVVSCFLGMASKEVMVSAPLIVLLYDRTFLAGSFLKALRRRWGLYLGLASTWLLLGWLVVSAQNRGGSAGIGESVSSMAYLCTQFGAIVHYFRLTVWPYPQVFYYGDLLAERTIDIVPYAIVVVLLGLGTCVALWRWPKVGFLGICFFAILAPSSSFVPVLAQTMAEHRMYLPLAAALTLIVLGGYSLVLWQIQRNKISLSSAKTAVIIGSTVIVVIFGTLTYRRNMDYQNVVALWEDTARKAPYNVWAEYNLAGFLVSHGPSDDPKVRYEMALPHYWKAIKIRPECADTYTNLGVALTQLGRTDEAIEVYRQALKLKPKLAATHYDLGVALIHGKQREEAIERFQKAIELKPDYTDAYYQLGLAYMEEKRYEEAVANLKKTVELDPERFGAHHNLAIALTSLSRFKEAVEQYRAAVKLKPTFMESLNNMANLLASCPDDSVRNGEEAVKCAMKAAHLCEGSQPVILDTLAAAYAEAGQFPEAVHTIQMAIDMVVKQKQLDAVKNYQEKLLLYEAKKPYRSPMLSSESR